LLGRAGDDFEAVDVVGVKAGAFDGDTASVDLVTVELAVFNHSFTGGQRRLRVLMKPQPLQVMP
jgi:hypothetical protein